MTIDPGRISLQQLKVCVMPLPSYLGICPYCQSRVAAVGKVCVNCGHALRTGEAQQAAQEKGLYNPDKKPGIRGWLSNRRRAPRHDVQLEAHIQPRLLLSISLPHAQARTGESPHLLKLIGSTRNVSESGLALVVSTLRVGSHLITEEDCPLKIVLDIYPQGLIEMEAVAVRSEQLDERDREAGYLVGVCITNMSDGDRRRYLQYLAGLTPKAV